MACGHDERVAVCGNGIVESGEACDDGINDGEYGHCGVDCLERGPWCGNGSIETGEVCDDGEENGLEGACCARCKERYPGVWEPPTSCDETRPQATAVTLTSAIGTTTATRALFGVEGWLECSYWCDVCYCVYRSSSFEFTSEGDGGAFSIAYVDGARHPESGVVTLAHSIGNEHVEVEAMMIIDGVAGSWDVDDPSDPPRVFGHFEGGATGAFEAVYCDARTYCQLPD